MENAVQLSRRRESDEALIYCGPSIDRVLKQYAVYSGPLPKIALDVIKKHPCIKKMFIPVSRLPAVKIALMTPGTVENLWFNKIYRELPSEISGGGNTEVRS
ncbi:MAG: hypothetical protein LBB94_03800 [Clostridiales bacterium]|nr:hypothetical protein [Clostridiales bacterium]